MVVTEKWDVYSFGVLILEVLMGKHPGQLIIDLHSLVGTSVHLEDVLDDRLSPPTSQKIADELALMVNLVVSCSRANHNLAQPCKVCVNSWRCKLLIIKLNLLSPHVCRDFCMFVWVWIFVIPIKMCVTRIYWMRTMFWLNKFILCIEVPHLLFFEMGSYSIIHITLLFT